MTTSPFVELRFNPTDLRPGDLPRAGAFLGTPAEALESALAVARATMVDLMREEVRGIAQPTHNQMLQIADAAWQIAFYRFRRLSAPVLADAYLRAYLRADAGEVPMSVIYNLADKHAEKIGDYFHDTSRTALADGFTTMVNRRLPAKAAADRVLDAYGLTPRQMRGFTSAKNLDTPLDTPRPFDVKARARAYIDRSFTTRIRKLSEQEEHNIDEQAKQYAWMWLQDKEQLSERAQKLWITAKDERVCPTCGPLHGQKVLVNERFVTKEGEFWTPGLHPNCRCVVRLIENRFTIGKADWWNADNNWEASEHPRAASGRFTNKPVQTKTIDVDQEFAGITALPTKGKLVPVQPKVDTETDEKFKLLVAAQTEDSPSFAPAFSLAPIPQSAPVFTAATVDPASAPADTATFTHAVQTAVFQLAPPDAKLNFMVETVLDVREAVATAAPTRTKPPAPKLDQPLFTMILPRDLGESGDISKLKAHPGLEWSTDEIRVVEEIGDHLQDAVDHTVEEIFKAGTELHSVTTEGLLHAKLSEDDVIGVVDWVAKSAATHAIEPDPEAFMEIEWFGEDEQFVRKETVTYSAIADRYEVDRSQFEAYLVWADSRHDTGDSDDIEDVTGSANSVHRSFTLGGDFQLVPGTVAWSQADHAYGSSMYKVEPAGVHEEPE